MYPALAVPCLAAAQSERGGFIVQLGRDTIAIESFTRTGGTLDGRFASRAGQFAEWRYVVRFGPDGAVRTYDPFLNHSFALYELLARAARAAARDTFKTAEAIFGSPNVFPTSVASVGPDSLVVTIDNGLGVRLRAVGNPPGAAETIRQWVLRLEWETTRAWVLIGKP